MKQRVNIQYSVQIEELPAELKRMSEKATSSLEETLSSLKQEPEDILSLSSHQHYDEIRVKLASVDAALSDINNIVESYLSYKTQQIMQDTRASTPQPPLPEQISSEVPNNLSELQNKIASFKDKLSLPEGSGEIADQE